MQQHPPHPKTARDTAGGTARVATMTRVRPAARPRRTRAVATGAIAGAILLAALGGTGFGADTATVVPEAEVLSTISIADPSGLEPEPALCTNSLAPLDTDDCADVSFVAGAPDRLELGALSGSDVQAASLQWNVTTTNPGGYTVSLRNAGAAPVLRAGAANIADMPATMTAAAAVPSNTHFGVAAGDATTDSEASVAWLGSPWVTGGGGQGELFRGVPTGGVVVAQRITPQAADPITLTFAAAGNSDSPPAAGSYTGTLELTASVI